MNIRDELTTKLRVALGTLGIESPQVSLDLTADLAHGDYATSAALAYAKQLGLAPKVVAERLVAALGAIDGVSKSEIAGPGFINFSLEPKLFWGSLERGITEPDTWGSNDSLEGKRIMVEYTDPNPFKVFHIGHLMSNAIGEALSRLVAFSGAKVSRANYQGDVGLHVAKAINGVQTMIKSMPSEESSLSDKSDFLGAAYSVGAKAYDGGYKESIDELNKILYEIVLENKHGDTEIKKLYDWGRRVSLAHFEEIYKTLGTKFDLYFFESQTAPIGLKTVENNPSVFDESGGAIVYKGEKVGLHTRVFVTSKGLPTYEAKDLGLIQLKEEAWRSDVSITVTASEQTEYFKVVIAALKEINKDLGSKISHVTHGMMRLSSGKMSSRTGDVISGESLLDELVLVSKERSALSRAEDREQLARDVAVAAVKFQILKGGTGKDIIFDRERALSLEGDSGPYLQYTHARTCAILEKATASDVTPKFDTDVQPSDLVRLINRFTDIVLRAQEELEPHLVATYLIQLASAFNSWYAQEQILDGTPAAAHKVAIVDVVRQTLKNGLWLLGIPAPKKM